MENFSFPFPGRELADRELSYDPCYKKIPAGDRAVIVERAWRKGCAAAREVFSEQEGNADFSEICRDGGLTLVEKNIDFISGNQRYFSDYISGQKVVNLYRKSIDIWAAQNGMDYETAKNLILSHEYYHFCEMTRLGPTSRDYTVPMLTIGRLRLGKTGIRALSEIGAHAFARTYYELLKEKQDEASAEL